VSEKLIALIRGINVGKAKRVAMADLRALVEKLGYSDVRTLLNSGNIVFTSGRPKARDVARQIEDGMSAKLGVSARVMVLTAAELTEAVKANPLQELVDNPSRFLVAVLADPADRRKLVPLLDDDWAPERLALGKRVAYLWCPTGILKSALAAAVNGALADGVTARNWATVLKLHALAQE
jgi:uncharacterized protein (DUF1697 family)